MSCDSPGEQVISVELMLRFARQKAQLIEALELCMARELYLPVLLLVYSTIDAMASGGRVDGEATGLHFREWSERYLLQGDPNEPTSEDLWAARCAVLHSHGSESKLSRQRNATELAYALPGGRHLLATEPGEWQVRRDVDLQGLVSRTITAVEKFERAVYADPALQEIVCRRARKWLRETKSSEDRVSLRI